MSLLLLFNPGEQQQQVSGEGAVSLAPTIAGTAVVFLAATGAVTPTPAVAGTALQQTLATGAVTITPTVAGTAEHQDGQQEVTATGAISLTVTLDGQAIVSYVASGALTVTPTVDGTATVEQDEPDVGTFSAPGGASRNPRWKLPPWLEQREEQEQRVEDHATPTQDSTLGAPAYLAPVEVTFPDAPPVVHREIVVERPVLPAPAPVVESVPEPLPDAATPRPFDDDDEETVLLLLTH